MVTDYFNSEAVEDLVRAIARYDYMIKSTQDYYDLGGEVCVSYADQAFIDRGDKIVYVDKENRKNLAGALVCCVLSRGYESNEDSSSWRRWPIRSD